MSLWGPLLLAILSVSILVAQAEVPFGVCDGQAAVFDTLSLGVSSIVAATKTDDGQFFVVSANSGLSSYTIYTSTLNANLNTPAVWRPFSTGAASDIQQIVVTRHQYNSYKVAEPFVILWDGASRSLRFVNQLGEHFATASIGGEVAWDEISMVDYASSTVKDGPGRVLLADPYRHCIRVLEFTFTDPYNSDPELQWNFVPFPNTESCTIPFATPEPSRTIKYPRAIAKTTRFLYVWMDVSRVTPPGEAPTNATIARIALEDSQFPFMTWLGSVIPPTVERLYMDVVPIVDNEPGTYNPLDPEQGVTDSFDVLYVSNPLQLDAFHVDTHESADAHTPMAIPDLSLYFTTQEESMAVAIGFFDYEQFGEPTDSTPYLVAFMNNQEVSESRARDFTDCGAHNFPSGAPPGSTLPPQFVPMTPLPTPTSGCNVDAYPSLAEMTLPAHHYVSGVTQHKNSVFVLIGTADSATLYSAAQGQLHYSIRSNPWPFTSGVVRAFEMTLVNSQLHAVTWDGNQLSWHLVGFHTSMATVPVEGGCFTAISASAWQGGNGNCLGNEGMVLVDYPELEAVLAIDEAKSCIRVLRAENQSTWPLPGLEAVCNNQAEHSAIVKPVAASKFELKLYVICDAGFSSGTSATSEYGLSITSVDLIGGTFTRHSFHLMGFTPISQTHEWRFATMFSDERIYLASSREIVEIVSLKAPEPSMILRFQDTPLVVGALPIKIAGLTTGIFDSSKPVVGFLNSTGVQLVRSFNGCMGEGSIPPASVPSESDSSSSLWGTPVPSVGTTSPLPSEFSSTVPPPTSKPTSSVPTTVTPLIPTTTPPITVIPPTTVAPSTVTEEPPPQSSSQPSTIACPMGDPSAMPPMGGSVFSRAEVVASTTYESTFYILTKHAGSVASGVEPQFVLLSATVGGESWAASAAFGAGLRIVSIAIRSVVGQRVLFAHDFIQQSIVAFSVEGNMTQLYEFGSFAGNSMLGMAGLNSLGPSAGSSGDWLLVADRMKQCVRVFKTSLSSAQEELHKTFGDLGPCTGQGAPVPDRTLVQPGAVAVSGDHVYIWDMQMLAQVVVINIDSSSHVVFKMPELGRWDGIISLQVAADPQGTQDALLFTSSLKALLWFPDMDSQAMILWSPGHALPFVSAFLHPVISGGAAFNLTFVFNATGTSMVDVNRSCEFPQMTEQPSAPSMTQIPGPSSQVVSTDSIVPSTADTDLLTSVAADTQQPTTEPATTARGTPVPTTPQTPNPEGGTPDNNNNNGSLPGAEANNPVTPSESTSAGVIIGIAVAVAVFILVIFAVGIAILLRRSKDGEKTGDIANKTAYADGHARADGADDAFTGLDDVDHVDDGIDIGAVAIEMDELREGTASVAATTASPMGTVTMSTSNNTSRRTQELFNSNDIDAESGSKRGSKSSNIPTVRLLERSIPHETPPSARHSALSTPETAKHEATGSKKITSFQSAQQMIKTNCFSRLRLIGRGAFGSVFNCILDDGQVIAMKEMLLPEDADKQLTEIMAEVDLVSELAHPNVVQYYGCRYEREENKMLLFMELAAGGSLATVARRAKTTMSEQIAQRYFRQVLEALSYIHSRGVVHRDLKCDNVLLSQDGQCKLGDFGTSRVMQNTTKGGTAMANTMIGTPVFMAPEMILDQADEEGTIGYTKKADIWSFGILCLEFMNRGNPPWPSFSNQGAALFHIASEKGKPIIPDGVSDEFRDFIGRCCERDPAKRATAAELLQHSWFDELVLSV